MKHSFAEVVESCLDHYTAHCWQWDSFPRFGQLIGVNNESATTLGFVTAIQTGSIDPLRMPFPYQKTEDELRAQQPQIFEFLKTTFNVQIVGYREKSADATIDRWRYLLPPAPCKIHAFVAPADLEVEDSFFTCADYLHPLFSSAQTLPLFDELLLAIVKERAQRKAIDQLFIDDFCQTFTLLTGNDYRRLKSFLKRLEALL